MGTGAPADITVATEASASNDPEAVFNTFANAAGDANTMVAVMRSHASFNAAAVRVLGDVTSISARPVVMPSAGPYSANGANAATNRSFRVML